MLLVPTFVGPSAIHGTGLFAAAPIPAGTVVWEYSPIIDHRLYATDLDEVPAVPRAFLERHGYWRGRWVYLCGDDGRFVNHADAPCLVERADGASVAARDIAAGEELTEDYYAYDDQAARKLGRLDTRG